MIVSLKEHPFMPFTAICRIYIKRKDGELTMINTLKGVEEKDCGSAVWIAIIRNITCTVTRREFRTFCGSGC